MPHTSQPPSDDVLDFVLCPILQFISGPLLCLFMLNKKNTKQSPFFIEPGTNGNTGEQ